MSYSAWPFRALHGLLFAGLGSAIVGWEPGVFVALAAFGGLLGGHLLVGLAGYRRVMSRPWPRVEPISRDDDW